MLHEGNESQEKFGKQGWLIARRCIAVAMDQGGSIKIGSQIFPEFVQVQTEFLYSVIFAPNYLILLLKVTSRYRLRAICGLVRFRPVVSGPVGHFA
jgi:hypothetical protein